MPKPKEIIFRPSQKLNMNYRSIKKKRKRKKKEAFERDDTFFYERWALDPRDFVNNWKWTDEAGKKKMRESRTSE